MIMLRTSPLRWFCIILLFWIGTCAAWSSETTPKILLVVAHPDDELLVAGTIYRLTTELNATIDQLVITNGEGGFRYASLAEKIYGLKLTDETVARRELPAIRKREALAAGEILGIRNHYFLDEPDRDNTDKPDAVLKGRWDVDKILNHLDALLSKENYDFLLTALPRHDSGGHHLAATLLAIRALNQYEGQPKSVLLGAFISPDPFEATMAETIGFSGKPDYHFDRTRKFGFNEKLDYQIIANWVIAEHKSQGLYQTNVGRFEHEYFWVFNRSDDEVRRRADALFSQLNNPNF